MISLCILPEKAKKNSGRNIRGILVTQEKLSFKKTVATVLIPFPSHCTGTTLHAFKGSGKYQGGRKAETHRMGGLDGGNFAATDNLGPETADQRVQCATALIVITLVEAD